MVATFTKATKRQARLRMAFIGPAGSGKTYSALAVATGMGGKIALIDTEHGSASKYAGIFEFDTLELDTFEPSHYVEAIAAAEQAGYTTLVIDSLSHAWAGKGGVLEFVDTQKARGGGADPTGWQKGTKMQNDLVEKILGANIHIIATMRSKMSIVIDRDDKTGKQVIRKVGLQPIQRDGLEYEFDVVGDLDQDATYTISKSRCPQLSGISIDKPGKQLADVLTAWLTDGAPALPVAHTTTSAGAARPYTVEQLKERFVDITAACLMTPMSDKFRGLMASWIDLCFVGQADVELKRHSLVKYLTGKLSLTDVTWQELRALRKWLNPVELPDGSGGFKIDVMAEKEAQTVITQAMKDSGQQEIPLFDEERTPEEQQGETA